jgi:hypothetical protein
LRHYGNCLYGVLLKMNFGHNVYYLIALSQQIAEYII